MTNAERQEFERRKTAAEQQLNEMYYGVSRNAASQGTLKMPSFLSPVRTESASDRQRERSPQTKPSHTASGSGKTPPRGDPPKGEMPVRSNGINLLNMLNFKGMQMDHDRLMILALCLLLSSEETDELLLLALIYTML